MDIYIGYVNVLRLCIYSNCIEIKTLKFYNIYFT